MLHTPVISIAVRVTAVFAFRLAGGRWEHRGGRPLPLSQMSVTVTNLNPTGGRGPSELTGRLEKSKLIAALPDMAAASGLDDTLAR